VADQPRFVFVNYARSDRAAADAVSEVVFRSSFETWRDTSLIGGEPWWDAITEAIRGCDIFVYIVSHSSLRSRVCLAEFSYAYELGRSVLPVVIDTLSVDEVPREIAEIQWVQFQPGDKESEERLLQALQYFRSTPPLPDPLPPPPPVPIGREASEPTPVPPLDLAFSDMVRSLRDQFDGPVTASAIADVIRVRHGDYASGQLASVTLRSEVGEQAPVDEWLRRVQALYDPDAVARSRHNFIDDALLLAGLIQLSPELAEDLADLSPLLRSEIEVAPRRPPSTAPEQEIGFSADLVGDRHPVRASDDLLGIEDDVRTLSRLVMAQSTVPPLAVGLFGDWGTGKSFFLQRMRTRIDEMMQEAAQSAIGFGSCEHVVQVTFNAWHYLDADLWASLANRLYQGVAGSPATGTEFRERMYEQLASTRSVRAQAVAERARAEKELAAAQTKLDELRDGRLTVADAASAADLIVRSAPELAAAKDVPIGELASDVRFGQGLIRRVVKDTRTSAKVFAVVAVVLLAVAIGLLAWFDQLAPLLALVPSALAAGWAWVHGFGNAFRSVRKQAEQAQRVITDAEANLRRQVDEARTKQEKADVVLAEIRDGGLVRRYLIDRVQSSAYRDRLGLVSLVREDLETLVALLDPDTRPNLGRPIDRIVLYIDDLDRCPPTRVVEVLEAIHLLLAFPLFVVVVAVDSRWLLTSLELYYRELLGPDDAGVNYEDWQLTPANYLEKIFQIPLVLRPMSEDGYARLVHELAGVRTTTTGDGRRQPMGGTTTAATSSLGSAAPSAVTHAQGAPPDPDAPTVLLQTPIEGDVLTMKFTDDGRALVVVTTAGVSWWERGRRSVVRHFETEVSLAAVSPTGRTVAVVGVDRMLTVVDADTGEQTTQPLLSGMELQDLAVARADLVFGVTTTGTVLSLVGGEDPPSARSSRSVALTVDGEFLLWSSGTSLVRWPMSDGSSRTFAPVDDFVLASDDELLTSTPAGLRRWKGTEWRNTTAPAGLEERGYRDARQPELADVHATAARSSEGWWLVPLDGAAWCWADNEPLPSPTPVVTTASRVAADPRAPATILWGADGFDVVDVQGVRYRSDVLVDDAAVSPLGRLVATAGGGELRLWQIAITGAPELPSQLELEPEEAAFIVSLAPLVGTPRVAKRLLNVYRLLRASAVGRARLADPSTGDYRVALLLLALVVGQPELADAVLDALEATKKKSAQQFIRSLLPPATQLPPVVVDGEARLRAALTLAAPPTPSSIDSFREWGRDVRRFHVAPADLRRPAPPSAPPPQPTRSVRGS
jgi:hypothetical protein